MQVKLTVNGEAGPFNLGDIAKTPFNTGK